MTLFQVVYGQPPPSLLPYEQGSAQTETIDDLLTRHDELLVEVHDRLLQAQQYARKHYDAHHCALEFGVGD